MRRSVSAWILVRSAFATSRARSAFYRLLKPLPMGGNLLIGVQNCSKGCQLAIKYLMRSVGPLINTFNYVKDKECLTFQGRVISEHSSVRSKLPNTYVCYRDEKDFKKDFLVSCKICKIFLVFSSKILSQMPTRIIQYSVRSDDNLKNWSKSTEVVSLSSTTCVFSQWRSVIVMTHWHVLARNNDVLYCSMVCQMVRWTSCRPQATAS